MINIGIPSKGRLRKDVLKIFKNKKMNLISERGERDLFGSIKKLPNAKIIYLHAREIIERLGDGSLDIGFSGFDLLKEWGIKNRTEVIVNPTISYDNERISSSRIREALLVNNFALAKELLGRSYTFSGKVVFGQQLGSSIGIPTANLWIPKQRLPISGVYAVRCMVNSSSYNGIANMGIRPTVGGKHPVLEVHIFNFNI